jgi:hypothetical protein
MWQHAANPGDIEQQFNQNIDEIWWQHNTLTSFEGYFCGYLL